MVPVSRPLSYHRPFPRGPERVYFWTNGRDIQSVESVISLRRSAWNGAYGAAVIREILRHSMCLCCWHDTKITDQVAPRENILQRDMYAARRLQSKRNTAGIPHGPYQ